MTKSEARLQTENDARLQRTLTLAHEIANLVARIPSGTWIELPISATNDIRTKRGMLRFERDLMTFRLDDDFAGPRAVEDTE